MLYLLWLVDCLYLQTHRMAPNLTTETLFFQLLHCSRCRQKLNPMIHPITRITDVNTLYDYLEEATVGKGMKGAKVSRSQRSPGTSQWVAMLNKSGLMWTDVISRERLWCLHLSFQHVFGSFANIASMIVPYWSILWQFFYVFLCQVFIPAIYKNSTDIQLAESISPLDPEAKDGHGWPICMMQQTDVQPHKASLANMLV